MAEVLSGVRAKIDRAKQHAKELELTIESWAATTGNAAQITGTEEKPEWKKVSGAITAANPPPVCSLQVGDIVHNLRCALDHLMCQLAILEGKPGACAWSHFPIVKTGDRSDKKKVKRNIAGIGERAGAAIKELQPYKRGPVDAGSHPLWILSELDNIDKHRLILVIDPKLADGNLAFRVGEDVGLLELSRDPEFSPLERGAIPFAITLTGADAEKEVEVHATAMIGVVFKNTGLKCDGANVAAVLNDLFATVTKIVDDFERDFF